MTERIKFPLQGLGSAVVSGGSSGLDSQCPGQPVTVSAVAEATGGIGYNNLITTSTK